MKSILRFCLSSGLAGLMGVAATAATNSSPVTFNKEFCRSCRRTVRGVTGLVKSRRCR